MTIKSDAMLKLIFLNAVRNIRRNILRTLFSVFIIGSMVLLFILLHTVSGMLTEQFARALMHYDIVIQSRYANSPLGSHIDINVYKQMQNEEGLKDVDAVSIIQSSRNGDGLWIVGIGNFPVFAATFGILLQKGHVFQKGRSEMIVGNNAIKILRHGLGDSAMLNGNDSFKISGTYSSFFTLLNSAVLIDLEKAIALSPSKKSISMLLVNVKENKSVDAKMSVLRRHYPKLLILKSEKIANSMTTLRDISRVTLMISWLVFATAAIAILNTLLITTIQRTKEIGILSAIGWSKSMIVSIFLTESMILSMFAALGGLVLSKPLLWIFRHYTSLSIYIPGSIAPDVIYKVGAMALIVGFVGVLAPMVYIFRMNISEALRHE